MVSVTGVGSGLDIEGLVTQLVNAERAPVESRLLRRETALTAELSAFGTLTGALDSFRDRVGALADPSTFTARTASSSDSDVVTATATADAPAGRFRVGVDQLATAQSLASGVFAGGDAVVGEGTLTLSVGTVDVSEAGAVTGFSADPERAATTIAIDSSNNTLAGVRDAINAADAGVSASIVNDAAGARLLLTANDTGAGNSVELRVSDAGDSDDLDAAGLSRLAFNSDASNLEQTAAGTDARFSLNGLALTSASNTVEDALEGVTLSLRAASGSEPATVTIAANRGAVRDAIEAFVEGFNGLARTNGNLTRFDAETGAAGPLLGDSSARTIFSQVRSAVTDRVAGAGSLAELGIVTGADGTLSIDDARLDSALEDDLAGLAQLFTADPDGIAVRTDAILGGFLRSGGLLETRTEGIQTRVDGISDDRASLDRRLDALEARFRNQFNALDSLLAELQSTGDFISQQLASIPLPGDNNN